MDEERFGASLALYKALEIRSRVMPLYLARNLRYFTPNKAKKVKHDFLAKSAEQKAAHEKNKRRLSVKAQSKKLTESERDTSEKRSLIVQLIRPSSKHYLVVSVFSESNYLYKLVESYLVDPGTSGGNVDVPLEYAFALRKRGESLFLLLQQFHMPQNGKVARDSRVEQIHRTDGPCQITCVHCRSVRHRSLNADQILFDDVHEYRPHGISSAPIHSFKFAVWKDNVVQSDEVQSGDGETKFFLLWSDVRIASRDCREDIPSIFIPPPRKRHRGSTIGLSLPKPSRYEDFSATRLEQVLPLEFFWANEQCKQVVREFRCPVCDLFLGSWFGVLTHFRTDHDRFALSEHGASTHKFMVEDARRVRHQSRLSLLAPPPAPLRFARTSAGTFEMYSDVSEADLPCPIRMQAYEAERDRRALDEFTDITPYEKEMMGMWNKHVRTSKVRQPRVLAMEFVASHRASLLERNLVQNFLLLLITMHDFGKLTADDVLEIAMKVQD